MNEGVMNPENKKDNVRLLRRYLGLSQKEFINNFLTDEAGKAAMSVATLSNLEVKAGSRLNEVVLSVSERLNIDAMMFSLDTEEFADRLKTILPDSKNLDNIRGNIPKRKNVSQLVHLLTMYFAEQIFEKKLKKGDKIESDRVLAEKMQVGRSAVREALKVLDILGMIEIHPGQGSYISNNESGFFVIPMSWSLFLNDNQVDSILTVRNLLEIKAAELAASEAKEENLLKLHNISHRMHLAYTDQNYKEFLDGDLDFHSCIAECSQNQIIYSMIQTISNLMRRISGTGMADALQLKAIYDEHQRIYGLIIAKDAKGASDAMRDHLDNSMSRYNYQ